MGKWSIRLVFTIMVFTVIVGSIESVDAFTITLSDEASCLSLGGSWTSPICTISSELIITVADVLIINPGITLEMSVANNLVNFGSITNNGVITLTGDATPANGNIDNMGTGTFSNLGTINISGGSGDNSGVIINRNTATFSSFGTINISGGSGFASGNLVNIDTAIFSNSGTINLIGDVGANSGRLRIIHSSTFSNLNIIIITGGSGQGSGYLGTTHFGKFTNAGTLEITGSTGVGSGQLDNWNDARIDNSGSITITGGSGKNSGQLLNMGNTVFSNTGLVTIIGGSGEDTGRFVNSENGGFINNGIITITIGPGTTNFPLLNKDGGTLTNRGTFATAQNLGNTAKITNFGTLEVGNNLNNNDGLVINCGTIIIGGSLIGNSIKESGCIPFGSSASHEDPTIGKLHNGHQVVEDGFCIIISGNIDCITVDEDFIQHYDLRTVFKEKTITVVTTVYCHVGVSKCNYIAIGVSPIGTNMNSAIWKIILEKNHRGEWSTSVLDENGYLGDVTTTTQEVNDGKHLVGSFSLELVKSSIIEPDGTEPENLQINVEVRDIKGGYRDFKLNEGILVDDPYAYPKVESNYEEPITLEPLCLNENANKRYTCAFDMVRDWTIKNAEKILEEKMT